MNSLSQPTSPSLIARVKAFDAEAWRRLAALYTPVVYEWARRAGLQECDSADLAQEVFQAVLSSIDRFEYGTGTPRFRAWLWGITRNKIRDHFRRVSRQPMAPGGSDACLRLAQLPEEMPEDPTDAPADDLTGGLARRALGLIRSDFSDQTWQAFWQVAVEGLAAIDVADRLGMKVGAVYTAKSRVLALLRRELEGLD